MTDVFTQVAQQQAIDPKVTVAQSLLDLRMQAEVQLLSLEDIMSKFNEIIDTYGPTGTEPLYTAEEMAVVQGVVARLRTGGATLHPTPFGDTYGGLDLLAQGVGDICTAVYSGTVSTQQEAL